MKKKEELVKETKELCEIIKLLTKKIDRNMKKMNEKMNSRKQIKVFKFKNSIMKPSLPAAKQYTAAGLKSYDWNNSIINWKNSLRD